MSNQCTICKVIPTPYVVDKNLCLGTFQTIQSAIDTATLCTNGGTIYIHSGTYIEDLTITGNINLVSVTFTQITSVVAPPPVTIAGQINIVSGSVIIVGITMMNNGRASSLNITPKISNTGVLLYNCKIISTTIGIKVTQILEIFNTFIDAGGNAIVSIGASVTISLSFIQSHIADVITASDGGFLSSTIIMYSTINSVFGNLVVISGSSLVTSHYNQYRTSALAFKLLGGGLMTSSVESFFDIVNVTDPSGNFITGTGELTYGSVLAVENNGIGSGISKTKVNFVP